MKQVHIGLAAFVTSLAVVLGGLGSDVSATQLALAPGQTLAIAPGGPSVTVHSLDTLPFVDDRYSRRFEFDRFRNPKLRLLREREHLDSVVAGGKDEFDKQVRLLDWAFKRFRRFGTPTSDPSSALEILSSVDKGGVFFCEHMTYVFVSAAASLGYVVRMLALRRPDQMGSGSTEHSSSEIWSNQYRKWVMFEPTFAMYVEKNGVPLSAWEFRQEWFRGSPGDLVFVIGTERQRYRKSDLPFDIKRNPGFGPFRFDEITLHKYAFMIYYPNTDFLDRDAVLRQGFITRDEIGKGTRFHDGELEVLSDPAHQPYFPIDQAALSFAPKGGRALQIKVDTLTPNFDRFEARVDGGAWAKRSATFPWRLHDGRNRLEVKSVNQFQIDGPPSTVELDVAPAPKPAPARKLPGSV